MRMLMNNLDEEVAERPRDLVVYGGTGRAARSWASRRYRRLMSTVVRCATVNPPVPPRFGVPCAVSGGISAML